MSTWSIRRWSRKASGERGEGPLTGLRQDRLAGPIGRIHAILHECGRNVLQHVLDDFGAHFPGRRVVNIDRTCPQAEGIDIAGILHGHIKMKGQAAVAWREGLPDTCHEVLWLQSGGGLALESTYGESGIVGHLPAHLATYDLGPGVPQGAFAGEGVIFPAAYGLEQGPVSEP